jgi:hypothetical protein
MILKINFSPPRPSSAAMDGVAFNGFATNYFPVVWDPITMMDAAVFPNPYTRRLGRRLAHLPLIRALSRW